MSINKLLAVSLLELAHLPQLQMQVTGVEYLIEVLPLITLLMHV